MTVSLQSVERGLAILQVHRPQVHNAMDWEAMDAFAFCVEQAHTLPELRALIVTGTQKAFISGGDLKALADYPTKRDGLRLASKMGNTLKRLESLPCPTIAAMNGAARGGGAEIALVCDLRVMASDADIGLVQVNLGLTPGWGAGQRLLRTVGYARALEWLLTGRILSAQEALSHNLTNRLTPPGQALNVALELARHIVDQPPETVRAIKRLLRAGLILHSETAAALEQAEFPPLWAAEEHILSVEHFLTRK